MSFYRSILAAVAAMVIAAPVFAEDAAPTPAAANPAEATQAAAAVTAAKVNINKATAKDLMQVKGMNASKARAIVAYRKKNGDFKSVDELPAVKGFKRMKPEMLKEIQDQLTVE